MDNYIFRRADKNDIQFISDIRIEVLRKANKLENNINMDNVLKETKEYYSNNIDKKNHITYLAFDENKFIGCGSICFYNVMPTCDNQTGEKGYIMNIYTREEYRRKGIAGKILDLLIKDAKEKGIKQIQLETTEAGKYLYEKHGFIKMENEMEKL